MLAMISNVSVIPDYFLPDCPSAVRLRVRGDGRVRQALRVCRRSGAKGRKETDRVLVRVVRLNLFDARDEGRHGNIPDLDLTVQLVCGAGQKIQIAAHRKFSCRCISGCA